MRCEPPSMIQRRHCDRRLVCQQLLTRFPRYQAWFYIDTRQNPPRSSWEHPLGPPPPVNYVPPPGPPSNNIAPPPNYNQGWDNRSNSPYSQQSPYPQSSPYPQQQQQPYYGQQQQPYYNQQQQAPYDNTAQTSKGKGMPLCPWLVRGNTI